jgi:DNA gyrase subunit B
MQLDELQQLSRKAERRLRNMAVVEAISDAAFKIDTRADFMEKSNLEPLAARLREAKLTVEIRPDEEHSAWMVCYHDQTNADRYISIELASQSDYRRLRTMVKQLAALNKPPFVVRRGENKVVQNNWRDLLAYVKSEGMRDCTVQRYKGLGEMNSGQLWDTTMNADTRTMLKVDLQDLVESDKIFSTLMGEDVESRRKFIEDNALDVRNLDI